MSNFYNQASWVLVPSGIEEDIVFAQKPISGLGDLTFTRASDATYTDSTGVVRRSPYNLVTFSEMFSDASWSKGATTIGINTTTAPNGTLTADSIIGNGVSTTHSVSQSISLISGLTYTFSFYAKADTNNFIQITSATAAFGGTFFVNFNLSNGTVGSSGAAAISPSIQSIGNGWYRCSVSAVSLTTSSVVAFALYLVTSSTSVRLEANSLSTSLFLWGAQVVEGSSALDYFPTTNRQDVPRIDFRNADGTLSSCGRLLLEPQRTNSIRNSSMVGAVAGTPGTLPTNWSISNLGTLTRTVVGTGTENGLPYIDYRIQGTALNTTIQFAPEPTTQIAAANGQVWASSYYLKSVAGTIPDQVLRISQLNSGGTNLATNTQSIVVDGTLKRYSYAFTLNQATTAFVFTCVQLTTTVGATYDFTIRIAAPQMELGAYATTWVPTTTAAVTRIIDSYTRGNVFTNGLVTSAGGTWIVDLSNNLQLTRDGATSFSIGDNVIGTLGNSFNIRQNGGSSRFAINKTIAGSATVLYTTLTDNVKIAIKWNGSTADVFVNGSKVTSATAFTSTALQFMAATGGDNPKYINQMLLAPTPLSDAECIARTTL